MKKIMALLMLGVFFIASCARQGPAEKPEDLIGQGSPVPGSDVNGPVKEFRMTAKQFEFEPGTIEVNKGDRVKLIVTSTDVPHGISIPEYDINERLDVGKPVAIEFTADKEGTFTAFCSVFCGSGHSNMKGKIIVR